MINRRDFCLAAAAAGAAGATTVPVPRRARLAMA